MDNYFGEIYMINNAGERVKVTDLSQETCTFGSSQDSTVRLRINNTQLKPIHCEIQVTSEGYALLINKSLFPPVLLNGKAVPKEAVLANKDEFVLCGKKFIYINEKMTSAAIKRYRKKIFPVTTVSKSRRTEFVATTTKKRVLEKRDSIKPDSIRKCRTVVKTKVNSTPRQTRRSLFTSTSASKVQPSKRNSVAKLGVNITPSRSSAIKRESNILDEAKQIKTPNRKSTTKRKSHLLDEVNETKTPNRSSTIEHESNLLDEVKENKTLDRSSVFKRESSNLLDEVRQTNTSNRRSAIKRESHLLDEVKEIKTPNRSSTVEHEFNLLDEVEDTKTPNRSSVFKRVSSNLWDDVKQTKTPIRSSGISQKSDILDEAKKTKTPNRRSVIKYESSCLLDDVKRTKTPIRRSATKHESNLLDEVKETKTPNQSSAVEELESILFDEVKKTKTPNRRSVIKRESSNLLDEVKETKTPNQSSAVRLESILFDQVKKTKTPNRRSVIKRDSSNFLEEEKRTKTPIRGSGISRESDLLDEIKKTKTPIRRSATKRESNLLDEVQQSATPNRSGASNKSLGLNRSYAKDSIGILEDIDSLNCDLINLDSPADSTLQNSQSLSATRRSSRVRKSTFKVLSAKKATPTKRMTSLKSSHFSRGSGQNNSTKEFSDYEKLFYTPSDEQRKDRAADLLISPSTSTPYVYITTRRPRSQMPSPSSSNIDLSTSVTSNESDNFVFKTPLKTPKQKKTALSTGKIQKKKPSLLQKSEASTSLVLGEVTEIKDNLKRTNNTLKLNSSSEIEEVLNSGRSIVTRRSSSIASNARVSFQLNETESSPVTPVFSPRVIPQPSSIKKSAAKAKRSSNRHNESIKDHLVSDTPILIKSQIDDSIVEESNTPIQNASTRKSKSFREEVAQSFSKKMEYLNKSMEDCLETPPKLEVDSGMTSTPLNMKLSARKSSIKLSAKESSIKLSAKKSSTKKGIKRQLEESTDTRSGKKIKHSSSVRFSSMLSEEDFDENATISPNTCSKRSFRYSSNQENTIASPGTSVLETTGTSSFSSFEEKKPRRSSLKRPLSDSNLNSAKKKQQSLKNELEDFKEQGKIGSTAREATSPYNDLTNVGDVRKAKQRHREKIEPRNELEDLRGVKQILRTPREQRGPKNELEDIVGVKKLMVTPKEQKQPKNELEDLRGVKKLLGTPKQQRGPRNELEDIIGVKKLMATPKEQKDPKNELEDVRGVKRLLRTPREQKGPKNELEDLTGVKKLMTTPKEEKQPKNELEDLRGVKKLLGSPKQQRGPKNELEDIVGVKKLMATPKEQKDPKNELEDVRGVKKLLRTPREQKGPTNELDDLTGVKKLLATPKEQKEPRNELEDVRGVKGLLKTPRGQRGPKNELEDLSGVKNLLATPKEQKQPKNELDNMQGVRMLLRTPKEHKGPKNNIEALTGIKRLMSTPRNSETKSTLQVREQRASSSSTKYPHMKQIDTLLKSPQANGLSDTSDLENSFSANLNVSGVELLEKQSEYDILANRKYFITYRAKSASPVKQSVINSHWRKTMGHSPELNPDVHKWVEEQTRHVEIQKSAKVNVTPENIPQLNDHKETSQKGSSTRSIRTRKRKVVEVVEENDLKKTTSPHILVKLERASSQSDQITEQTSKETPKLRTRGRARAKEVKDEISGIQESDTKEQGQVRAKRGKTLKKETTNENDNIALSDVEEKTSSVQRTRTRRGKTVDKDKNVAEAKDSLTPQVTRTRRGKAATKKDDEKDSDAETTKQTRTTRARKGKAILIDQEEMQSEAKSPPPTKTRRGRKVEKEQNTTKDDPLTPTKDTLKDVKEQIKDIVLQSVIAQRTRKRTDKDVKQVELEHPSKRIKTTVELDSLNNKQKTKNQSTKNAPESLTLKQNTRNSAQNNVEIDGKENIPTTTRTTRRGKIPVAVEEPAKESGRKKTSKTKVVQFAEEVTTEKRTRQRKILSDLELKTMVEEEEQTVRRSARTRRK